MRMGSGATVERVKILAVRNDRFGEFLLNIPAFRALKQGVTGAHLTVAVSEAVAPLARAVPFVDDVIVCPPMPWGVLPMLGMAVRLRKQRFDRAVVLNPSADAHHVVFLAGIPQRVGWQRKHALLLTASLPDNKASTLRHEVENNLALAALAGGVTRDHSLALTLTTAALQTAGRLVPSGAVAIHPWTSDPVKQWPLERFETLIKTLALTRPVVIIGRPEKWHGPFDIRGTGNVIDLNGKTTLVEAAAVLTRCAVLVSGDSGPVHLAASVGTPVTALFRNDMPGKTADRWGPWGVKSTVLQRARLEDISVAEVLAALRKIVGE